MTIDRVIVRLQERNSDELHVLADTIDFEYGSAISKDVVASALAVSQALLICQLTKMGYRGDYAKLAQFVPLARG